MTVAAFMDLALYDPRLGYYARAAQRSGRAGDFFTSVDVGPIFGELLAIQLAEMCRILDAESPIARVDFVEAGAGNARLSADILRATRSHDPHVFERLQLHLVEESPEARRAQGTTLADITPPQVSSSDRLPDAFEGVLLANELLDALPVHQVVMRDEGLREVYVDVARGLEHGAAAGVGRVLSGPPSARPLVTVEGPLSTPALEDYLSRLGITLEPGWRVEINLRAVDWVREAARRLRRGFLIFIDYGHEARHLYSEAHATGTLTAFSEHRMRGPESQPPAWIDRPGEQDLTAHVDFTSVRAAAEAEGLVTLGFMDQTYFVLGLVQARAARVTQGLGLKTLLMPGGLGSTHKVLILGKGVGRPSLSGCSFGQRIT